MKKPMSTVYRVTMDASGTDQVRYATGRNWIEACHNARTNFESNIGGAWGLNVTRMALACAGSDDIPKSLRS